jgi:hypothetical protein
MTTWKTLAAVGLLSAALVGCNDAGSPTAPTPVDLTPEVRAALERSIQDEYRAETIYQGVVNDLGPLPPFLNVLTAEQRHSASIAQAFVRRGLTSPASEWSLDRVPHFSAIVAACGAAATAERDNIAMYDDMLRLSLPSDVRQVFENNRSASLVNHLPAFERCS